uniref:F-box domain-containing protein n=1 Tax=Moniliophthora roreri TaxID=221103 RepID=A0A0W0GCW3_MONRR
MTAQKIVPPSFGSPSIHRLPPEILTDIFINVDCISDHDIAYQSRFCHKSSEHCSRSTGSHLGSVCVYWRGVTLSSPGLWASLLVEIEHSAYPECILERLRLHIERSRSAALSVILKLTSYLRGDDHRNIVQALTASPHAAPPSLDNNLLVPYGLIKLIMDQTKRIRHFSLYLNTEEIDAEHFALPLFSHFQSRFPILEHITADLPYGDDPQSVLDLFTPSSRIVSFGISDPILSSPLQYSFPYSRMTNVHIKETGAHGLWTILHLCPNLRAADVVLGYEEPGPLPSMTELFLQHLESLSIEVRWLDDIDDLSVIINAVNLPALLSLSIGILRRQGITHNTWDMAGITQFTTSFTTSFTASFLSLIARSKSRSTSTIERLQLNCFPFRCDELIALTEKLPNLLELSISEPDWEETDLQNGRNQMLTCDVLEELASGRILPRLKNLRMVVNNDWVGSDAFERMIESRPRLDSVYLKIAAEMVPSLNLPRLRQLQQDQPGQALRIVQDSFGEQIELLGYGRGSSVDRDGEAY